MTRVKAFGIHLVTSVLVFAVVSGLLIFVWYPAPLFELEGGWQGLQLVALVDIVLGPALTLIVFKPGKPGLKLDMTLIALFQSAALGYGMWNLYVARPVVLVHAYDHIQPLTRVVLDEWDPSGKVLERWESTTPQVVHVDLPDDPVEFGKELTAASEIPGELHGLFDRYQALDEGWRQMQQDATRIEPYVAHNPAWQQAYDALLHKLDRPAGELVFIAYIGRKDRAFLVFDGSSRQILDVLKIPFDVALVRPLVPRMKRVVTP